MYNTTQDFYRAELEYRQHQRMMQRRPLFRRLRAQRTRNQIVDGSAA